MKVNNEKVNELRKTISSLEEKRNFHLNEIQNKFDALLSPLREELSSMMKNCEHKNKDVFKDYYSKIFTCLDCGLSW